MAHLNIDKLKAAKLETEPYLYTIVSGFLSPESVSRINATYPKIEKAARTRSKPRGQHGHQGSDR